MIRMKVIISVNYLYFALYMNILCISNIGMNAIE